VQDGMAFHATPPGPRARAAPPLRPKACTLGLARGGHHRRHRTVTALGCREPESRRGGRQRTDGRALVSGCGAGGCAGHPLRRSGGRVGDQGRLTPRLRPAGAVPAPSWLDAAGGSRGSGDGAAGRGGRRLPYPRPAYGRRAAGAVGGRLPTASLTATTVWTAPAVGRWTGQPEPPSGGRDRDGARMAGPQPPECGRPTDHRAAAGCDSAMPVVGGRCKSLLSR